MSQPLAVTGFGARSYITAVNVGMFEHVANIPEAPAFGLLTLQIHLIDNGMAETSWADQSTVAATEAAAGHVIPLGVIIALIQKPR